MKTIIIGIAGGTGSGKSTFTRKLKKEFKDNVAVLYHDNYYRDQSDIPLEERRKTNYDHPDAMETELLVRQLKELKEGKTIQCPTYDYTLHTRSRSMRTACAPCAPNRPRKRPGAIGMRWKNALPPIWTACAAPGPTRA